MNGEYLRYGLNRYGLPRHSDGEGALSHEGGAFCVEVEYIVMCLILSKFLHSMIITTWFS